MLLMTDGMAQSKDWKDMHKVKKSETLFGIAKKYGITVSELITANPEMNTPGYELKKGDYIYIPYSKHETAQQKAAKPAGKKPAAAKGDAVGVGVMLPLHNVDGDGRRMTEFYRGVLIACDDLRKEGISVNVKAWNLPADATVNVESAKSSLAGSDIIFGPLYTKQVKPLAEVARGINAKLVIPFSISGDDVLHNENIFQLYQSPEQFYGGVISHFIYRYGKYNVVVVDCNDRSSDKGVFTFNLRKRLEESGVSCQVTNLKSSDAVFYKAFSATKPNMVVLNTARSPELNEVVNRLDELTGNHPTLSVSLFGYTEWLMYTRYNQEKFFKYDTLIPTTSYYNQYSSSVRQLEGKYRTWFKSDMMDYLPRFAIQGYDYAMYFIRGVKRSRAGFNGAEAAKRAVQTQLHFARAASGGGYQNTAFMFVHFNRNRSISTIAF